MASLKGYIPGLARLIGTSPDALYERQRALVRAGLLAPNEGRGPGSGVRATAPSVAMLVLSVLAAERLVDTETRTRALAKAQPQRGRCPYTGMPNFLDAFAAILVGTGKAAGVTEIVVSRTANRAIIRYYDRRVGHELKAVEFGDASMKEPGISGSATLNHALLQQISADVASMINADFDEQEERLKSK